jgi:hypothetical protein
MLYLKNTHIYIHVIILAVETCRGTEDKYPLYGGGAEEIVCM